MSDRARDPTTSAERAERSATHEAIADAHRRENGVGTGYTSDGTPGGRWSGAAGVTVASSDDGRTSVGVGVGVSGSGTTVTGGEISVGITHDIDI